MDSKNCALCGRTIEYRKKWKNNWDSVKYCSDKCRKNKTKLESENNFETLIINRLNQIATDATMCPSDILSSEDKKNKEIMELVRQAARRLVHQGLIEITQKGTVVDPSQFKGPIRLRKVKKQL